MKTMTFSCHFCGKEMDYMSGMLMPVSYLDGKTSRVFTCMKCLREHDTED